MAVVATTPRVLLRRRRFQCQAHEQLVHRTGHGTLLGKTAQSRGSAWRGRTNGADRRLLRTRSAHRLFILRVRVVAVAVVAMRVAHPELLHVFRSDELLQIRHRAVLRRTRVVLGQVRLPVLVRPLVAPSFHVMDVLALPAVQRDRPHERNVHSQVSVNARAADANKNTQRRRSPSRIYSSRRLEDNELAAPQSAQCLLHSCFISSSRMDL